MKTMKGILIAIVCMFLCPLPAEGADWVQVTVTPRGDTYFVDNNSIVHVEDNVRATTKHVLKEPLQEEKGSIYSTRSDEEYDCRKRRTRRTSLHAYDMNNEKILWNYSPLQANSPEISVSWRLIHPGTAKHEIYKFLCDPQ